MSRPYTIHGSILQQLLYTVHAVMRAVGDGCSVNEIQFPSIKLARMGAVTYSIP